MSFQWPQVNSLQRVHFPTNRYSLLIHKGHQLLLRLQCSAAINPRYLHKQPLSHNHPSNFCHQCGRAQRTCCWAAKVELRPQDQQYSDTKAHRWRQSNHNHTEPSKERRHYINIRRTNRTSWLCPPQNKKGNEWHMLRIDYWARWRTQFEACPSQ